MIAGDWSLVFAFLFYLFCKKEAFFVHCVSYDREDDEAVFRRSYGLVAVMADKLVFGNRLEFPECTIKYELVGLARVQIEDLQSLLMKHGDVPLLVVHCDQELLDRKDREIDGFRVIMLAAFYA